MTNQEAIEILSKVERYGIEGDAINLAIKSLSEPKITVFTENQTIRWTDKVSLLNNGDIIDFYGKVIGHISFEEVVGNDGH